MSDSNKIYLKCVKEGSRLRMKIISPGYYSDANCQCPRDIRVPDRIFSVPSPAYIRLIEGPGRKHFYKVDAFSITVEEEGTPTFQTTLAKIDAIYESASEDCIVCMSEQKNTVFANCGHYSCCLTCATTIFNTTKLCPMCRSKIMSVVSRESIG